MGHLGDGERAGRAALPPLLPWNAVFIYGSQFLWGNHFCQSWGKLVACLQEISLAPPPRLGRDGGVAAGDALREEEEVSLQLCGGHLSGQPRLLTPSPSPLSGSEPGKGVGTRRGAEGT